MLKTLEYGLATILCLALFFVPSTGPLLGVLGLLTVFVMWKRESRRAKKPSLLEKALGAVYVLMGVAYAVAWLVGMAGATLNPLTLAISLLFPVVWIGLILLGLDLSGVELRVFRKKSGSPRARS
jgi:heme A synthase